MPKGRPLSQASRVIARIDPFGNNGCWIFTGSKIRGYGQVQRSRPPKGYDYTHRVMYELVNGPIPKDKEIDHLCRVRACCNPAHLEVVTHRQNVLRGIGFAAIRARQQTCIYGHDLEPNPSRPTRFCRTCKRRIDTAWRRRNGIQPRT